MALIRRLTRRRPLEHLSTEALEQLAAQSKARREALERIAQVHERVIHHGQERRGINQGR